MPSVMVMVSFLSGRSPMPIVRGYQLDACLLLQSQLHESIDLVLFDREHQPMGSTPLLCRLRLA